VKAFWTVIVILILVGSASALLSWRSPETPVESATTVESPTTVMPESSKPPANSLVKSDNTVKQEVAPSSTATAPTGTAGTLTIGLDQKINGATVRPGRLVEKDGAILADGKYLIRGAGTAESPYEVSWELLMSASDTFIPRLGEREIPQRIALLNNAHVRVSGYIAFPLIVTEATECLVMLNQWDGCCLGVPPSPYDAIEVKLSAAEDNSKRHVVRVGTLEGVLRIDPYVVEKWLVGLYTMDNGVLSTEL